MRRYAPDVYGLPGAASFFGEVHILLTLAQHYQRNQNPVAFIDESYESPDTQHKGSFYVIAVAVVEPDELSNSRAALRDFYGGDALHASHMFQRSEMESLRQATELVSKQNDGMDIVVCAPIKDGDDQDAARSLCLSHAAAKVHKDLGVSLFVLDRLSTPTECKLDQFTFSDLRKGPTPRLARDTSAIHARPSEEILLGLPDVLAWAYRQEHTRGDGAWFEPMREFTQVTVL